MDYERVPVDIFAGETMSEEYAAKNPALTTPVLELEPGRYLPQSGAILLHLAEGTQFLPGDPWERAQVHEWLFFEQGTILITLADLRFRLLTERLPADGELAQERSRVAAAVVALVERYLGERQFLVGERYTVADIALYGYLHVAHEALVDMSSFPAVGAWLDRVREQPGHVNDLQPYPDNAKPGESRSIYDL